MAIRSFAQLLPEHYDDAEFRQKFGALVISEVERLDDLVNQIGAFANQRPLVFGPLKIEGAIREAVTTASHRAPRPDVPVEVSFPAGLPTITADESSIVDCLTHLILNAMEALQRQETPRIAVTAERNATDPDGVTIRVHDNGAGVPPDMRDKIFSPFCTGKARGIGLGLPIARRAVIDHGGQMSVESSAQGTTVTLVLPIDPTTAEKALDEAHSRN
jgi:nitrogen-specific signal transduction histidine kinase